MQKLQTPSSLKIISGIEKPLMAYIHGSLQNRHKPEMVMHEAARAFVNIIIFESAKEPNIQHVFGYEFKRAIEVFDLLSVVISVSVGGYKCFFID